MVEFYKIKNINDIIYPFNICLGAITILIVHNF